MKTNSIQFIQNAREHYKMRYLKNIAAVLIIGSSVLTGITSIAMADGDLPVVSGEVKKVKPKSGKITIKHGAIPNLDMPGMTMVFRTEEGTDISQFKKGDDVAFTVIDKDGKMVIVTIEKSE